MRIIVENTYEMLSLKIAKDIVVTVKNKPNSLICIAGGHTPQKVCEYLINSEKTGKVDFSQCFFVSLDEWVGLDINTVGSCVETLYTSFFNHISTPSKQIRFFNGKAKDLSLEIKEMKEFISSHKTIDLILLGIGMNGHVGFNEPNIDPEQDFIVVPLDPITKEVSAKYFDKTVDVKEGISLGMKIILESKNIMLMANGIHKADIMKESIEGTISNKIPASLLRKNTNLSVYLDILASSKLSKE